MKSAQGGRCTALLLAVTIVSRCSALISQCGGHGEVKYTYRYGDDGGDVIYAGMCPSGSFVNEIMLSTDSTARVTEVDFTCDDPGQTSFKLTTLRDASNYNYDDDYADAPVPSPPLVTGPNGAGEAPTPPAPVTQQLTLPSGLYFSSATGFTGANSSDIVTQLTFSTSTAQSVSAGSNSGYNMLQTLPFSFQLPPESRIIGFNSTYSLYVDSIALIYCA